MHQWLGFPENMLAFKFTHPTVNAPFSLTGSTSPLSVRPLQSHWINLSAVSAPFSLTGSTSLLSVRPLQSHWINLSVAVDVADALKIAAESSKV